MWVRAEALAVSAQFQGAHKTVHGVVAEIRVLLDLDIRLDDQGIVTDNVLQPWRLVLQPPGPRDGSGGISGVGVRFESHFGYMFSHVRGPLFSGCGQSGAMRGPGAGIGSCFGVFLGAGCRLPVAKPGSGFLTSSWGSGGVGA